MSLEKQGPNTVSFETKPIKVTMAGKIHHKKTPYQTMKERIEAAEKMIDEMATREETYKKAARESLRQLVCLRVRLNDCIRWLRAHVIDREPIVIPDREPIVIEDEYEEVTAKEEKPDEICLPPNGLQKSPAFILVKKTKKPPTPVAEEEDIFEDVLQLGDKKKEEETKEKKESMDDNEDLFGDSPIVLQKAPKGEACEDEEKLRKRVDDVQAGDDVRTVIAKAILSIKAMLEESLGIRRYDVFRGEWYDDIFKVTAYYDRAHPSPKDMDEYFKESCDGWLHLNFSCFADFFDQLCNSYEMAILDPRSDARTESATPFTGEFFPETQV